MEYTGTRIPEILRMMERDNAYLARKMGMSKTYVGQVFLGQRRITPEFVARAVVALNLPADALFFSDPDMRLRNHERVAVEAAS